MYSLVSRTTMVIAGAALLLACDEPAGPGDRSDPQLGILQLEEYVASETTSDPDEGIRWTFPPEDWVYVPPQVLNAPSEVEAGEPFLVNVTTIGVNGCWSAEGQDVQISGRTVELKPYDVHSGHDICTQALVHIPHPATITLDSPGEWTIRVSGRRARHGDETWETPVAAERTIVVR